MGKLPAMEPMLIMVPREAMRRGAKAWVTVITAKTFTSNIFFAIETSVSSNGAA